MTVFSTIDEIVQSKKKYKIIYADPAWKFKSGQNSSRAIKYDTMDIDEIKKLPVEKIADKNAILFMWGTWAFYDQTLKVIESWGFNFKTCAFVWYKKYTNNKQFMGCGFWTRANTEYCLLATRGKPKRKNADVRQVYESVPRKHSQKPDVFRDRIVRLVGNVPRIELFARINAHGWDSFGNDSNLKHPKLKLDDMVLAT